MLELVDQSLHPSSSSSSSSSFLPSKQHASHRQYRYTCQRRRRHQPIVDRILMSHDFPAISRRGRLLPDQLDHLHPELSHLD